MIEIENLEYTAKGDPIISGISMTLHDMEITGICGPPGAGKSVLLNILDGSTRGYTGSAKIEERELSLLNKNEHNRESALCNARWDYINYESTLYNFILQGRSCYRKLLNPYNDTDKLIVENCIDEFLLQPWKDIKLKNLPDSVIQTGKIARTIARQSSLLLLDTPDQFLNINQKKNLYRILKKYVSSGKKMILIASADINFLSNICDRIVIMDKGKIIEDKLPGELTADSLKKIFKTEVVMIKNIITGKNEFQIIE